MGCPPAPSAPSWTHSRHHRKSSSIWTHGGERTRAETCSPSSPMAFRTTNVCKAGLHSSRAPPRRTSRSSTANRMSKEGTSLSDSALLTRCSWRRPVGHLTTTYCELKSQTSPCHLSRHPPPRPPPRPHLTH